MFKPHNFILKILFIAVSFLLVKTISAVQAQDGVVPDDNNPQPTDTSPQPTGDCYYDYSSGLYVTLIIPPLDRKVKFIHKEKCTCEGSIPVVECTEPGDTDPGE